MRKLLIGDNRETLATLDDGIAQTCVTSPPYWGLRDYGHESQIGLEQTPADYVAQLVAVFREVRRVLADDGTLWLNLGDSYASNPASGGKGMQGGGEHQHTPRSEYRRPHGLKPKDLVGIPWRVAFALQADGWYLRSDIIWAKPNPMPESVKDRPTSAHEHVFLLAKSERYFYDADAIREPHAHPEMARNFDRADANSGRVGDYQRESGRNDGGSHVSGFRSDPDKGRNARNVWTIGSKPYSGAHFATMPPDLAKRCILAGSRPGDVVIDPFFGSGTTGQCAEELGRGWIGCELQEDYVDLINERTAQQGLGI
jgi:DNA modification methylase